MSTKIIQDGKGHIVGYLDQVGKDTIARDERSRPVARYWKDGNLTINLKTGAFEGKGDQTMRFLK